MEAWAIWAAGLFLTAGLTAEKPAMQFLSSPNWDERPADARIQAIVIHDTNHPGIRKARTIANHFLNPRSKVSAHYIIGKAGEIIQCVPDEKRAWHAGISRFLDREHVNDFSLGIELVNDETGKDPFTEAQYAALSRLLSYLIQRYQIPDANVIGHRDVALPLGIKQDPADNFDWLYLWKKTRPLLPKEWPSQGAFGGGNRRVSTKQNR
ncbi:MAG: N-acetylmuramoyl-L-alanine amidase [Bacteroidota bacterium]